jgi:hypothetical protein
MARALKHEDGGTLGQKNLSGKGRMNIWFGDNQKLVNRLLGHIKDNRGQTTVS